MPSYANSGDVTIPFDLLKMNFPNVKTLRIEITPSLIPIMTSKNLIEQSLNEGYNVIATYHDFLGSNDINNLLTTAKWWVENYNILSPNNNVIINICNEWGDHSISSNDYANGYNQAIQLIRQVYKKSIIIDIPGWGQEVNTAADASYLIQDKNIYLSMHLYPMGWNQVKNRFLNTEDIDTLINTGLGVLIGEFGTGNGPVDVNSIINYAKQKGINILLWGAGDGTPNPYNMELFTPTWYESYKSTTRQATDYFKNYYNVYI